MLMIEFVVEEREALSHPVDDGATIAHDARRTDASIETTESLLIADPLAISSLHAFETAV